MDAPTTEADLRAWLLVVWRRRWLVAGTVAVGLLAATAFNSRSEPVYRSSAQVLVQGNSLEGVVQRLGFAGGATQPGRALANEVVMVNSDATRDAVAEALGYSASVSVAVEPESDVLVFAATASEPDRAAQIVNAYVDAFAERRRELVVEEMVKVTELLDARRRDIAAERQQIEAGLEEQRVAVATAATEAEAASAAATLEAEEARAEVRRDALDAEESGLDTSLSAVNLVDELRDGSGVQVVVAARPASEPVSASSLRSYLVAGIGSLLAGIAMVLLIEYLDNRIRSRSDLQRAARDLPLLAMVPDPPTEDGVVSISHPRSTSAEAYRGLRTSVQFLGLHRPLRIVLVTSASSSEGKTTTVANLGVALARVGRRVVVLDADLRRPRLAQRFGLPARRGLTNVLLGDADLVDVAVRVPDEPNLVVVPSGPLPPHPSELLSSARSADLIRQMAEGADIVLIDSPPVLPVADSVVLAGVADGVLVVARAGHSQRRLLSRAIEVMAQVDAPLLGTVLAGASDEPGAAPYYYGEYGDELDDDAEMAPGDEDEPARPPSTGADHGAVDDSPRRGSPAGR